MALIWDCAGVDPQQPQQAKATIASAISWRMRSSRSRHTVARQLLISALLSGWLVLKR